jgi:hypothetical protein
VAEDCRPQGRSGVRSQGESFKCRLHLPIECLAPSRVDAGFPVSDSQLGFGPFLFSAIRSAVSREEQNVAPDLYRRRALARLTGNKDAEQKIIEPLLVLPNSCPFSRRLVLFLDRAERRHETILLFFLSKAARFTTDFSVSGQHGVHGKYRASLAGPQGLSAATISERTCTLFEPSRGVPAPAKRLSAWLKSSSCWD